MSQLESPGMFSAMLMGSAILILCLGGLLVTGIVLYRREERTRQQSSSPPETDEREPVNPP